MNIFQILVVLSGFEEEDLHIGVFGETAGDDAAGGTSSYQGQLFCFVYAYFMLTHK